MRNLFVLAMAALGAPGGMAAEPGVLGDVLVPTGPPAVSAAAKIDEPILTVPVTYGHTAVLSQEVHPTSLLGITNGAKPLPPGTPMFGVPFHLRSGPSTNYRGAQIEPHPDFMWCSASNEPGTGDKPWNVTCFVQSNIFGIHKLQMAVMGANYFPSPTDIGPGDPASPLTIEERAIDLHPPLNVIYQFAGWENDKANIRVRVSYPGKYNLLGAALFGRQPPNEVFERIHLDKDQAGVAHLRVMDGDLLIRPGPDGKSATIEIAAPLKVRSQ